MDKYNRTAELAKKIQRCLVLDDKQTDQLTKWVIEASVGVYKLVQREDLIFTFYLHKFTHRHLLCGVKVYKYDKYGEYCMSFKYDNFGKTDKSSQSDKSDMISLVSKISLINLVNMIRRIRLVSLLSTISLVRR